MVDKALLQQCGLTEKQASVYLAMLQLGASTIQEIAKVADIKRPTTYLIIEELQSLGLVAEVPKKGKRQFTAVNPERLLLNLNEKRQMVTNALPELLSLYNQAPSKPKVILYDGRAGVAQVYRHIADEAKEVLWLADINQVQAQFPDELNLFLQLVQQKKMRLQEIHRQNAVSITLDRRWQSAGFVTRYTTLPIATDFAIFNNKIAIFSVKDPLYAVVLEDIHVVESFRSLFTLAWKSAVPLSQVKISKKS